MRTHQISTAVCVCLSPYLTVQSTWRWSSISSGCRPVLATLFAGPILFEFDITLLFFEGGGWVKMRLQQHACCRCCCSLTSCVNDQNDQCKATLVPRATVGISNWIPIWEVSRLWLSSSGYYVRECTDMSQECSTWELTVVLISKIAKVTKMQLLESNFGFRTKSPLVDQIIFEV